MQENLHIYELVRANLMAAVKGVYFEDPRFVVKRIDRYFSRNHCADREEFLEGMAKVLNEIIFEFNFDLPEFQRITETILELEELIEFKMAED